MMKKKEIKKEVKKKVYLKKPCKRCHEMFTRTGKFQVLCDDCHKLYHNGESK